LLTLTALETSAATAKLHFVAFRLARRVSIEAKPYPGSFCMSNTGSKAFWAVRASESLLRGRLDHAGQEVLVVELEAGHLAAVDEDQWDALDAQLCGRAGVLLDRRLSGGGLHGS